MRIQLDLPRVSVRDSGGAPNDFQYTKEAIKSALTYVQQIWVSSVSGALLPGMNRPMRNTEYADSIQQLDAILMPDGHELAGSVISRYKYTSDTEEGYGSFDQKPGMVNGPKSREIKDSKGRVIGRYNLIPLRHATPKTPGSSVGFATQMPTEIYNLVKRKDYGGSLNFKQLASLDRRQGTAHSQLRSNPTTGAMHSNPIYEGLTKKGAPNHSNYLTFRTVSTNSKKGLWIHPGLTANPVMAATAAAAHPVVEQMIAEAVRRDVMAALGR